MSYPPLGQILGCRDTPRSSPVLSVHYVEDTDIQEQCSFPRESVRSWRKDEVQWMFSALVVSRKSIWLQKLQSTSITPVEFPPLSSLLSPSPVWEGQWWDGVRVDGLSTSRVDGPSTRLVETRTRQHAQCWWVMETSHPSTRAVNSGSGNRA